MINYELYKKLKDAGFNQMGNNLDVDGAPIMKRGEKGQNYISGYGYISENYADQAKNYKPEFILKQKTERNRLI